MDVKLTLAYDGTNYHGWQSQVPEHGPTIQDTLQEALCKLTGEKITATAAGRTDAGVHALGQVVSFSSSSRIPLEKWPLALNSVLPPAIVARRAEAAPAGFNARFAARAKTYRYLIWNSRLPDPFYYRYSNHVPVELDLGAMRLAAGQLVGRHDFRSFAAAGGSAKTFTRTVHSVEVAAVTAGEDRGEGYPLQPLAAVPAAASAGTAASSAGLPLSANPLTRLMPSNLETVDDIPESPPAAPAGREEPPVYSGQLVYITITADAFLYNMVRIIAGTLLEVGKGKLNPADLSAILAARDRAAAGPTAPPQGLFLVRVDF